jgi:hypothetical protein
MQMTGKAVKYEFKKRSDFSPSDLFLMKICQFLEKC